MRRSKFAVLVLALLVSLSCANDSSTAAPAPAASSTPAPSTPGIAGKAAPGTVVTVEPVTPRDFPLPEGPAIMDQYAKQFVPDMLLVRVGQPVEFRNSEDSPHNVNVNRVPTGTEVFNVATAPFEKHVHTFEQAGQYAVACDIHPGMLATVVATTTPYVAVVAATGAFQFSDLTPGDYTVRWTSSGQTGEKTVKVTAGTTTVSVP
jgi:Copper binding proteins, plastocyanin/azurin family